MLNWKGFCKKRDINLCLATVEAIVSFADNEGRFALELQDKFKEYKNKKYKAGKEKLIEEYIESFTKFATAFKVIRTVPRENKPEILKVIFDDYLPDLEREKNSSSIQKFAEEIKKKGLNRGVLLSLFSKAAFLFMPQRFTPYDKHVKSVLKKYAKNKNLNYKVEKNYVGFLSTFNTFLQDITEKFALLDFIEKQLYFKDIHIVNVEKFKQKYKDFLERCRELNITDTKDFLIRRLVDKMLMLCGGFEEYKLDVCKKKLWQ